MFKIMHVFFYFSSMEICNVLPTLLIYMVFITYCVLSVLLCLYFNAKNIFFLYRVCIRTINTLGQPLQFLIPFSLNFSPLISQTREYLQDPNSSITHFLTRSLRSVTPPLWSRRGGAAHDHVIWACLLLIALLGEAQASLLPSSAHYNAAFVLKIKFPRLEQPSMFIQIIYFHIRYTCRQGGGG